MRGTPGQPLQVLTGGGEKIYEDLRQNEELTSEEPTRHGPCCAAVHQARAPMPLTTAHDSPSRLTIPSRPHAVLTVMWLAAISGGVFALDRGTGLPHVQHL